MSLQKTLDTIQVEVSARPRIWFKPVLAIMVALQIFPPDWLLKYGFKIIVRDQ